MSRFLDLTLNGILCGNSNWFSEALNYFHKRAILDVEGFLSGSTSGSVSVTKYFSLSKPILAVQC